MTVQHFLFGNFVTASASSLCYYAFLVLLIHSYYKFLALSEAQILSSFELSIMKLLLSHNATVFFCYTVYKKS